MKKALAALVLIVSMGFTATSIEVAGASVKTTQYALANSKAKCRTNYVKRTITVAKKDRVKVHGKWKTKTVNVRKPGCVFVAPKILTGGSTTTGIDRAKIDPDFTQNQTNPLDVTFTYSASATNGPLADGVLDFYWGDSSSSQTLGCSMNVDAKVTGGTCEVVFASYGKKTVTVQYVSGAMSATETDAEDIEAPAGLLATLPASTTTTVHVSRVGQVTTLTATVVDQNGKTVTVDPSTITYQILEINISSASVLGTSAASANGSCSFASSNAGSSGIGFGGSAQPNSCQFPGGGFYAPSSGNYGVDVVFAGTPSSPGSTSPIVQIVTP